MYRTSGVDDQVAATQLYRGWVGKDSGGWGAKGEGMCVYVYFEYLIGNRGRTLRRIMAPWYMYVFIGL